MQQAIFSPNGLIEAKKGLKLVIVGGVAGGASAATRARRLDGTYSCANSLMQSTFAFLYHLSHLSHLYRNSGNLITSVRPGRKLCILRHAVLHWWRDY